MANRKLILLLGFLLAVGLPGPGEAAKVYKWTDEHGNVSYRDQPPPGNVGKVEKKDINPDRNVIGRQTPATRSQPASAKTAPAGGQGADNEDEPRHGGLSPAEQAAIIEQQALQGGATTGASAIPGPAVPTPPPPTSGSAVAPGPAVPVVPPPTPGSGVSPGPAVPTPPPPTAGPGGI